MSAPHNTLLVDIGNSRIKYTFCSKAKEFEVHAGDDLTPLISLLDGAEHVLAASVGKHDTASVLQQMCCERGIRFQLIETQPEAFGIRCAYAEYQNLGVDRWLAVLGARLHTQAPVAILDLGTAATCDVLVENQHLGGWIAPGFQMMRKALTTNTSKVFADDSLPRKLSLGTSTPDCVKFGGLAMLEGFVISAQKQLAAYASNYQIFICGGDAHLAKALLNDQISFKPNLVFDGLSRFAGRK